MISRHLTWICWLVLPLAHAQTGFPFQDETLRYNVNWPSGLSLGEAVFAARHTTAGWSFELTLDAAVPGFAIADKYGAAATSELCSTEFMRRTSHGTKQTSEKTSFDHRKGTAHRATLIPANGGETDFDSPPCPRDALSFVYFVRKEMGQGRVAPAQRVFFGSAYNISLQYTGAMNITSGDKQVLTDHVAATVKGPKANITFEIFFARDAARTPLQIKIPLSVGAISVDLVR